MCKVGCFGGMLGQLKPPDAVSGGVCVCVFSISLLKEKVVSILPAPGDGGAATFT